MWLQFCLIIFLAHAATHSNAEDDTIIDTKQGRITGIKQTVLSDTVTAYLGIPYAEAPTGEKRFKKPEARKPWPGIYNANAYGNSCYQSKGEEYKEFPGAELWIVNNEMSEDCLNLNIWVPQSIVKPAQVMVFIYGGGFISGTSSLTVYDGRVLAATEKVLVVSINYRVGALGFLALPGNKNAPGNAALFDQRLALQWVHENIEAFGGNKDSVTIFGQSAGAASVGYQVISAGSQAYFKRAILQSGTPTAFWALNSDERARKLSIELAQNLGCPIEDDDGTIACLQKIDAEKLTDKQISSERGFELTYYVPVLDNDFISADPKHLVKQAIQNIDILIGITKDDGNPFPTFAGPGFSPKNESLITTEQLEQGLKIFFPPGEDLVIESIKLQYIDWDDEGNREKNRKAMELILRDNYFACPLKYFANQASEAKNRVFVYEYDHRPSTEPLPEWMGAAHGAELPMIFGTPLTEPQKFLQAEQTLSKRIMKTWSNFARNGTPSVDEVIWPQYSAEDQKYAILNLDGIDIKEKWNSHNCQFWNVYYPQLLNKIGKC